MLVIKNEGVRINLFELYIAITPDIMLNEVGEPIKALKKKKAPGCDGINVEILQVLGKEGVIVLWKICNAVWSRRKWPL